MGRKKRRLLKARDKRLRIERESANLQLGQENSVAMEQLKNLTNPIVEKPVEPVVENKATEPVVENNAEVVEKVIESVIKKTPRKTPVKKKTAAKRTTTRRKKSNSSK